MDVRGLDRDQPPSTHTYIGPMSESTSSSPTGQEQFDKWLVIHSRVLNETILMVFDKADLKAAEAAHPGKVIYFPQEVRELQHQRTDPEFTRQIHMVKKKLGGWIVPSDSPYGKALRRYPDRKTRPLWEKLRREAERKADQDEQGSPEGESNAKAG